MKPITHLPDEPESIELLRINAIFGIHQLYMPDITMFMSDEFNLLDLPSRSAFLN